jgi:DNA-binding MarR family transcriptional regulator
MCRLREEYLGAIDDLLREVIGSFLRPPAPSPARDMNVTLGQMDCLRTIGELREPTMSEVAAALRLHPSTVTVLVDGLVAHGLVKRRPDPKDRRVVRVAETARGRRGKERHMAAMRARVAELLSEVNDEDLQRLHDSLHVLQEAGRRWAEASGHAPARALYRAKGATPDD